MKLKLYAFLLLFSFAYTNFHAQSVAQNWSKTDCISGNPVTLFNLLDSNKVVVMEFEMGCSSCSICAGDLEAMKLNYDASAAGQVKFFAMDYWSGHACSDVSAFVSYNSLSFGGFAGCANDKNYYASGSPMPLVVVAGGPNHSVYYEKSSYDSLADYANIQSAINQALADIASGISNNTHLALNISIASNPSQNEISLNVTSDGNINLDVQVFNLLGQGIMSQKIEVKEKGFQNYKLNTPALPNGIYFIRYKTGSYARTIKFMVGK